MLLLLFPVILPSKTLFSAVAGGEERVGGSMKAWLCAFLHHQGKSKARSTLNGQLFESMWQSEQSRVGVCATITEETLHKVADAWNSMTSVLHGWLSVSLGNRAIGKKSYLSTTLLCCCARWSRAFIHSSSHYFFSVCLIFFFPSVLFFLSIIFMFLRNKPVDRQSKGQSKNGRYLQTARGHGYV